MTIKKSYQGTFIPFKKSREQNVQGKGVNSNSKLNPKGKKILKELIGGGFQKIE